MMRIVPTQNLEFTQVLGKLSAWCHAVGAKGPYPNFSEALQLGVSSAMRIIPKMNRWSIPNSIQLAVFLSCSPCSPKAENLIPPESAEALVANLTKAPRRWQRSPAPPLEGDPGTKKVVKTRSKSRMRHKQNDQRFPKSLIKVKTTKHCQGHPRPIMQMC